MFIPLSYNRSLKVSIKGWYSCTVVIETSISSAFLLYYPSSGYHLQGHLLMMAGVPIITNDSWQEKAWKTIPPNQVSNFDQPVWKFHTMFLIKSCWLGLSPMATHSFKEVWDVMHLHLTKNKCSKTEKENGYWVGAYRLLWVSLNNSNNNKNTSRVFERDLV